MSTLINLKFTKHELFTIHHNLSEHLHLHDQDMDQDEIIELKQIIDYLEDFKPFLPEKKQ